jgi:nicotinamidase-related amidase
MPYATRMSAADTGLLVVDVQAKLIPSIARHQALIRNLAFLIDAARLLNLPIQATEQYPKGLGPTMPELAQRLPVPLEKVAFSCCAIPAVVEYFEREARPKIVVAGIETHVCILQTVLDLLARDFRVYLPVDAVGSRGAIDHEIALRRMEQAGAILTTVESATFEWIGSSAVPQFKEFSRMVQERMKKNEELRMKNEEQGKAGP